MDLVNYKKDLSLEVMDEKGACCISIFSSWMLGERVTAIPDLNANANAVAIESLKIVLEGWERDLATKEPNEASAVPNPG